ncbi:MAG: prepilin-type N-terminal cleavage/methylation domain-containing protein [Candidatus Omnitrophica bacterium]|nr:prepilin-type N-terminal cleavage/methylation domain-containing protein [Candidatus Omnitrophota bacterium]
MKLRRSSHKRFGFTLVELVMTIVVVGIVAVPLSMFVATTAQNIFTLHDRSISANLARLAMEKVNNTAYASLTGTINFPNQGYSYNVQGVVTYVAGDAGTLESLKKIVVTVTRPAEVTPFFTLITYIAKNVAYGL